MNNRLFALALAGLLFGLMLNGEADYKAEMAENELYCEMVEKGAWPDYERRDCK